MTTYQAITEKIDAQIMSAILFKKSCYRQASMLCEARADGFRQYRDGLTIEQAEKEWQNA